MDKGNCNIDSHGQNPLTFLCIDPKCDQPSRSACFGCLFYNHRNHEAIEYSKIYEEINKLETQQGSASQQQIDQSLVNHVEKKRENMLIDLKEAIFFMDLQLFEDVYNFEEKNKPQNMQSPLLNQYQSIKQKPFHAMSQQEINIVINTYHSALALGQAGMISQDQNKPIKTEQQEKINTKYMANKKALLGFVSTYTENVLKGIQPLSYSQALAFSKNSTQDKNQVSNKQIENELTLKNQELLFQVQKLKEELQVTTVRFQSTKEANETLKMKNKQLESMVEAQKLNTGSQQRIQKLEQQVQSVEKENEELKEVLVKAKLAIDIYQIKFQQVANELQQNKREAAFSNLREAILIAQQDEQRQRQQRQQRAFINKDTECQVQ